MKKSQAKKRVSRKHRLLALQAQEYTERYHPELRDCVVDISPCGTFATVREVQK
jgi:hypothetical protein